VGLDFLILYPVFPLFPFPFLRCSFLLFLSVSPKFVFPFPVVSCPRGRVYKDRRSPTGVPSSSWSNNQQFIGIAGAQSPVPRKTILKGFIKALHAIEIVVVRIPGGLNAEKDVSHVKIGAKLNPELFPTSRDPAPGARLRKMRTSVFNLQEIAGLERGQPSSKRGRMCRSYHS
jgi:hypothetical protein